MGDWRPEERHHGVADELLDRATVTLQLGPNPCVVGAEDGFDVLWVERLGLRGEADEIAEEDGDDLAFSPDLLRSARAAHAAQRKPWLS